MPSLESLADSSHPVVRVLTRSPRPVRRGSGTEPTPVAAAARELSVPVVETASAAGLDGVAAIDDAGPDVLVVVAFGEILPPAVLGLAPRGAVNVHFSLLPHYRGATPVQHALLDGLEETGVTTMLLDAGMDSGPILLQRRVPVGEADDAGALGERLASVGGELLVATLDAMATGGLEPREQDPGAATLARKLTAADRVLDWSLSASQIVSRVRAFAPEPGARTRYRGSDLKVLRAEVARGSGAPGSLRFPAEGEPVVAAGNGAVRLLEVAPAGRKRMDAGAFWRGARPRAGEALG